MTTATAVRTQRNLMIDTDVEMEDQLRDLLNHAKLIANKMNALQEKVWPFELRKIADEICKVCDIPQVGVGYLYASFSRSSIVFFVRFYLRNKFFTIY